MHGAGGEELGCSHAYHRAPPLPPTGATNQFGLRPSPYCAPPGSARGPEPLKFNMQVNQRLVKARGTQELLRLHAEHGGSFNEVNLATCWSRLSWAGCGKGFAR